MGKTLTEIAQQLKDATRKVPLLHAFSSNGKLPPFRASLSRWLHPNPIYAICLST